MRVLRLGNKSYRKKPEIKDTGDRYVREDLKEIFEIWRGNKFDHYLAYNDPSLDKVFDNVPPANVFPITVGTNHITDVRATNTYYWSPERQTNIKEDK